MKLNDTTGSVTPLNAKYIDTLQARQVKRRSGEMTLLASAVNEVGELDNLIAILNARKTALENAAEKNEQQQRNQQ